MEAATVKSKKCNKGKIKKNIKNVLCRPDPLFRSQLTEEEGQKLQSILKKHEIDIPIFQKHHWEDLKSIPKDQRPKPPKLRRVDGLLFGIRECTTAIQNGQCSAVIIEGTVNPRMIVQPVIEACSSKDLPVVCLNGLRKVSSTNFGIPTSCLGVTCNTLPELTDMIAEISKSHSKPHTQNSEVQKMDVVDLNAKTVTKIECTKSGYPYLYRTSKKTRVFVPTHDNVMVARKFLGQDFIEFPNKDPVKKSRSYMEMILKKISNNSDRVKKEINNL